MLTTETSREQKKEEGQDKSEHIPVRSIASTINKQMSCIGENWNESPSHAHENDSGHNY